MGPTADIDAYTPYAIDRCIVLTGGFRWTGNANNLTKLYASLYEIYVFVS
jgi:hypothetical protein